MGADPGTCEVVGVGLVLLEFYLHQGRAKWRGGEEGCEEVVRVTVYVNGFEE